MRSKYQKFAFYTPNLTSTAVANLVTLSPSSNSHYSDCFDANGVRHISSLQRFPKLFVANSFALSPSSNSHYSDCFDANGVRHISSLQRFPKLFVANSFALSPSSNSHYSDCFDANGVRHISSLQRFPKLFVANSFALSPSSNSHYSDCWNYACGGRTLFRLVEFLPAPFSFIFLFFSILIQLVSLSCPSQGIAN